jgi:threonine/homoserine efflux transporter RhtA
MGPLDALWHLLNLFGPALGVGLLAPALAKLLWRTELRAMPWKTLAQRCVAAGMVVTLAGLVLLGQDGRMTTYAALVAACAATLWWTGLRRA